MPTVCETTATPASALQFEERFYGTRQRGVCYLLPARSRLKAGYVERLLISSLDYTWESRAVSIPMNQTPGDFVSYAIRMRFSVHASVLRARLTKFLIAAFGQGIARSVH